MFSSVMQYIWCNVPDQLPSLMNGNANLTKMWLTVSNCTDCSIITNKFSFSVTLVSAKSTVEGTYLK